jgi:2-iminobutanoate/2-iminopropanoate deaminase
VTAPHLSPILLVGRHAYLSGQLARNASGAIHGDIHEQTRQVISNLSRALESVGLTLRDVVKTTVWLTRRDDVAAFNAAYASGFGAHRPTRSTVICTLVAPEALVEIEATAVRHDGSPRTQS